MILTFTDFGVESPYLAQMKAAAWGEMPNAVILDMVTNAPAFQPRLSGFLLAHYIHDFPVGSVVIGVVDPGVGSSRQPVIVRAADRWFIGPDNGLFTPTLRLAGGGAAWQLQWTSRRLSASFHGRDIFAPAAGYIARTGQPPGIPVDPATLVDLEGPDDLDQVIYVDGYGNAITGRRADTLQGDAEITFRGQALRPARTFSDVPVGTAMWYRNANDLVEIAVNQGRADTALGIGLGDTIGVSAA